MRRSSAAIAAAVLILATAACSGDDGNASSTTTEPPPAGYVALGDSFSAGEGAPPYIEASGSCHRSDLTWPKVLDKAEPRITLLELRACGGATVPKLLGPWEERGEPAQVPPETDDVVRLVTVTIGGNDIGFSDIVAKCVLSDCADLPTSADFVAKLTALTDTLASEVYPALVAAYPNARIVHVGYPRLTPAAGDSDPQGSCAWLQADERPATVAIVDLLDEAIKAATVAAHDAGVEVTYLDVADAFAGHELCTTDPWVNDVVSLDSGRAHPTATGYEALAKAVRAGL